MSKLFYVINLDGKQLEQANNSTSLVMYTKERDFATAKCWQKCGKRPNRNTVIIEKVWECKQSLFVCITLVTES